MRSSVLILAVVVAFVAMAAAEPLLPGVGLGLGALAVGKVVLPIKAALAALAFKPLKFLGFGKRSVNSQDDVISQEMILASVGQLDPNGCLLKLLCHVQTKDEEQLTRHESALAGMFRESDTSTPYSSAFAFAAGVGNENRDAATCEKVFGQCPLEYVQLSSILDETWSSCSFQS